MKSRKSIRVKDKDLINTLLNLKEADITASFIYNIFGEFEGESKVNPYDIIDIPPNSYGPENKRNKNEFTTTVGIWIFNKWFIEKELFHIFGYINDNITGNLLKKINQDLSYALMEDRVTLDALKNFLIKTQLVMPFVSVLSPNHSEKILTCTKVINKKKEELIKKNKAELESGNVKVIEDVEKELLDFALEYIGDDPSMDSFLSGARSNISNHFKNMYIMKGAMRDPDPNAKKEYNAAFSNYTDGIKPEEYALYCNSASFGPYSRGNKTEFGGYLENIFTMGYQDVVLDEAGTDCGTKRFKYVELTKDNIKLYIYNFIIEPKGLVELTSQNMDKYIGKKVKMRFSDLCESEKICNCCAGNFFYKLGIKNIGLALMQVPSNLKNKAMKAFHDSTIKTTEMDPMKTFGYKE